MTSAASAGGDDAASTGAVTTGAQGGGGGLPGAEGGGGCRMTPGNQGAPAWLLALGALAAARLRRRALPHLRVAGRYARDSK
ncbi:MYXO-CTERM sorting domain-containing protein [Sorangium sp. So ce1097]|uniref:MYXO-CTERM sorting domain-containing protein n=1 Tax=Sorangium sp. So ce1097 TaxID=3133330 RepID=UPI003F5F21FA